MLNKIKFYFIQKKAVRQLEEIDYQMKFNIQKSRIDYHYSFVEDNNRLKNRREGIYKLLEIRKKN